MKWGDVPSTRVYTWVCSTCHRGWTSPEVEDVCPECGKPAEMRYSCRLVDLKDIAIRV